MTRGDIKTRVISEMKLDPGVVDNADRESFIRSAVEQLQGLGVFVGAYSQSVSASPAALPADFDTMLGHPYWDGRKLRSINRAQLPPTPWTTGIPVYYYIAVDPVAKVRKLYTYPVVNQAGTLSFQYYSIPQIPADDVTDLTTLGLPAELHLAVIDKAVELAHSKNGNKFAADTYAGRYSAKVLAYYNRAVSQLNEVITQNTDNDEYAPLSRDIFISP